MEQMTQEQQLHEVDVTIEEAQQAVKDRDDFRKLCLDPVFKRLILEKFLKEEPVRLVMLKGSALQENQLQRVDRLMYGIASLDNFFRENIIAYGDQMEQALVDAKAAREEIEAEEG